MLDFVKKKGNMFDAHCQYRRLFCLSCNGDVKWLICQEICKDGKDNEAVNTDCGPEMSSQSGLVSSNRPQSR